MGRRRIYVSRLARPKNYKFFGWIWDVNTSDNPMKAGIRIGSYWVWLMR